MEKLLEIVVRVGKLMTMKSVRIGIRVSSR